MNLQVGGALFSSSPDIFGRYTLPAALHFACNRKQGLELAGDVCRRVLFHIDNEQFIAVEVMSRDSAVNCLAKEAVILRRDIGGDQFALSLVSVCSARAGGRRQVRPRVWRSRDGRPWDQESLVVLRAVKCATRVETPPDSLVHAAALGNSGKDYGFGGDAGTRGRLSCLARCL